VFLLLRKVQKSTKQYGSYIEKIKQHILRRTVGMQEVAGKRAKEELWRGGTNWEIRKGETSGGACYDLCAYKNHISSEAV